MKRPVKSIEPNRLAGAIDLLPVDAADVGPELQAVRAAQPRHLILELIDPVQESRILDVDLREPGEGRSGEGDFQYSADVGEIRRETAQPQGVHDLEATNRPGDRVVVVGVAVSELVDERRTENPRVREGERLVLAKLLAHPDRRQVAFPDRVGRLVEGEAREDAVLVAEVVIDPGGRVIGLRSIRIDGLTIVVGGQRGGAAGVR